MWAETNLLSIMAISLTVFRWEIPIRHAISTDYDYTVPRDACITGFGSCFLELKLWYCVLWHSSIRNLNLKRLRTKSPELFTINFLEYATFMFSCNAILYSTSAPKTPHPPHPKMLIRADNTTEDSWTRKIAASSLTGKSLKMLFLQPPYEPTSRPRQRLPPGEEELSHWKNIALNKRQPNFRDISFEGLPLTGLL